MKRKLTLTIEENLLPKIKKVAIIQGTSLSEMVEKGLRDLIKEQNLSFANKWCGKFKNKITSKKLANKRYQYLLEKYL